MSGKPSKNKPQKPSGEAETIVAAVTDSVVSVNTSNVGMSPAMAMGNLYQSLAFNVGLASLNMVFAQYQSFVAHQAATAQGVKKIFK